MVNKSIFSGLEQGAKQTAKSLDQKLSDLKKSDGSDDEASSDSNISQRADVRAQIEMINKMKENSKIKEASYQAQDQEFKKQQQQKEEQQKNQHEIISQRLEEDEKRRKLQNYCNEHGFSLSVSKEGKVIIKDEKGRELKSLEEEFNKSQSKNKTADLPSH